MSWITVAQIVFVLLAGLGVSLLVSVSMAYRARRRPADGFSTALRIFGMLLVLLGVFGPLLLLLVDALQAPASSIYVIVSAFIYATIPIFIFMVTIIGQFRRAKLRTLLLCVAAAEERQLPIPLAVRALAWEQINRFGRQCRRFANRLEAGASLAEAFPLKDSETFVALDVGLAQQRLSDSIQESLSQPIRDASLLRFCYGAMLLSTAMSVIWFIAIKIAPVFGMIMIDFGQSSDLSQSFQYMTMPLVLIHVTATLVAIALAVYQLGFTGQNLPLINRLSLLADNGRILRSLAGAVAAKQSVEPTLRLLASGYPKTIVRVRLALALGGHHAGRHWLDTLTTARVITPGETAVLKSAERAGNLGWALTEMALRKSRRVESIWRMLNTAAIPLFTLVLAASVGLVAITTFSDLTQLIESLR